MHYTHSIEFARDRATIAQWAQNFFEQAFGIAAGKPWNHPATIIRLPQYLTTIKTGTALGTRRAIKRVHLLDGAARVNV